MCDDPAGKTKRAGTFAPARSCRQQRGRVLLIGVDAAVWSRHIRIVGTVCRGGVAHDSYDEEMLPLFTIGAGPRGLRASPCINRWPYGCESGVSVPWTPSPPKRLSRCRRPRAGDKPGSRSTLTLLTVYTTRGARAQRRHRPHRFRRLILPEPTVCTRGFIRLDSPYSKVVRDAYDVEPLVTQWLTQPVETERNLLD